MLSNQGVRYRVEDVVLDAQAMARRGTKIGEEASKAFFLMSLLRWECCPLLSRSCWWPSKALEGDGLDLAAHVGHRHLLLGHHGRLPRHGVGGGVLQPPRLDASAAPLCLPHHRPGGQDRGRPGPLLVQGGTSTLASCQALPSSSSSPLRPSQTQACLPGTYMSPPSYCKLRSQDELVPLFLTAVLGVSSGLFGSLPMIQVP